MNNMNWQCPRCRYRNEGLDTVCASCGFSQEPAAAADTSANQQPLAKMANAAKLRGAALADTARLAANTGFRPAVFLGFTFLLLVLCMILPLILSWPCVLNFQATYIDDSLEGTALLAGSAAEALRASGDYTAIFRPQDLAVPEVKASALALTVVSGPMLITGSPIRIDGAVTADDLSQGTASASYRLLDGRIGLIAIGVLLVLLLIADFIVADIYAMQKALIIFVTVWSVYSILLGLVSQVLITSIYTGSIVGGLGAVGQVTSLGLSASGLAAAPMKIAFVGGLYWVISRYLMHRRQLKTA